MMRPLQTGWEGQKSSTKHTDRSPLRNVCQVQAQGCGLGWGLPVEKWSQLKVPGQQSMPLILPEPQPLAPSPATNVYNL